MKEEVQFGPAGVTSVDWRSYPILMMPEAPAKIDVVLVNRPDLPPSGAGEPASGDDRSGDRQHNFRCNRSADSDRPV